jgi:dTDP-4-dehydrorhamnose reductase
MAELHAPATVLVLGAAGQLGRALKDALHRNPGFSAGATWTWADRQLCDLSRPDQVRDFLQTLKPSWIINAAAYTAVDRAESEPELALRVNADSVSELARHARQNGAVLVHYSTDYVFNGELDRPYTESDRTDPRSVYGRTKLAGEQAVQAEAELYLLLRTSWVFARHGGNFLKTMLKLAQERDALRVVADQWGSPTSARMLAEQTLQALHRAWRGGLTDPWGLYHLTCSGQTHWHGYAVHVLTQAAAWGVSLKVSPAQVQAIASSEFPTPATRPMNSRLDCTRWQQHFGVDLPDWRAEVDQVLADVLMDQGVLAPDMRAKITSVRSAQ